MERNKLREAREAMGYSQAQLGALMKNASGRPLKQALVSQIETGYRRSYPRFRREASRVLGVAEAELFPAVEVVAND